jgi:hypothetical protein
MTREMQATEINARNQTHVKVSECFQPQCVLSRSPAVECVVLHFTWWFPPTPTPLASVTTACLENFLKMEIL